ncbi:uncharacterized methyltransferase C3H7.11-like [Punica granatum]|uniref:Uncharacterized methyltransferase C3H7.11-like n=2 Tax=Punica granatum TaxID=22663 RepID=A0A6P8E4P0_PUNGR|nr:uncharacterized methyltransferase C3H7.11-like [Punica granatum]PKI39882.1 hypothetical protein CRG98_039722 [Punica granatum]
MGRFGPPGPVEIDQTAAGGIRRRERCPSSVHQVRVERMRSVAPHPQLPPLLRPKTVARFLRHRRPSEPRSPLHYQKNASKYWDSFYRRHHNKFFKDRHYLEKEWDQYFCSGDGHKIVLEVGCGTGNTIFPLMASYPKLYVHACDFSPLAISLVKSHMDFRESQVNAFVCDVAEDVLCDVIPPSSVDVVTLVFMLSAVHPDKMPRILQNIRNALKPNGHVLFRDYAVGDYAQVKLENKDRMICENFYFRGDGTCSFYFTEDFLSNSLLEAGFDIVDISTYQKQIENRSRKVAMDRCWIRAVFSKNSEGGIPPAQTSLVASSL